MGGGPNLGFMIEIFFEFVAFLSISLGPISIQLIPALDGGKLAFV